MKITAAVAEGTGTPFALKSVELGAPKPDEILVRVVGVGVCHTDIVFKEGQMIAPPVVLGHEGSGIVEAVGADVRKVKVGDRVAMTFRSCGACVRCASPGRRAPPAPDPENSPGRPQATVSTAYADPRPPHGPAGGVVRHAAAARQTARTIDVPAAQAAVPRTGRDTH